MYRHRAIFSAVAGVLGGTLVLAAGMGGTETEQQVGQDQQQQQDTGLQAQPAGETMQGQVPGQMQKLTAQDFVDQAASLQLYTIKAAEKVSDQAESPQLKDLAKQIVENRKEARDQLKEIADRQNIQVPDKMDAQHQQMIDNLDQAAEQGKPQFEQTFRQQAIQKNTQAVQLYRQAATQLDNPELRQFAQSQLASVQQHLAQLRQQHEAATPAAGQIPGAAPSNGGAWDQKTGQDQTYPQPQQQQPQEQQP